jgi:polyisoprenoid-binding protein YceI
MTVAVKTGLWQLDTVRSTVAVKHRTMWGLVTVKGVFGKVAGQGEVRPDGGASGTVTLDAASLDTKNTKRDTHLHGPDFFDAERHPTVVFAVHDAALREDDTVAISGELTVRGVGRPQNATAAVTESSADGVTLTTEFTVDRSQFGLTLNQLGMMGGLTTVTATLRFTPTPV